VYSIKTKPKVLITALRANSTLTAGRALAGQWAPPSFEIGDFHEPDVVLNIEYGYTGLSDLPTLFKQAKRFPRSKHFFFSECDWPYPVIPGAYTSLSMDFPWANSWSYLPRVDYHRVEGNRRPPDPQFLFSFLGRSATHPIRKQLMTLDSENTPCVDLQSATSRFNEFQYAHTYRELIANSKFVLCPRGFGASSIRLFETMSFGRAPVIISDGWRRPPGIPWQDFCVFVPESDIMLIPSILRARETDAAKMGQLAMDIYETFFAPSVFFEQLLNSLMSRYSEHDNSGGNLVRAWKSLGWREIWSVGSQVKRLVLGASL
jgi:Exostosin family